MTLRPTIIDCAAIAAAALICLPVAWSQNTFPSSGNVGVGTTSPAAPLQIANNGAEWSGWNFGTNLVINGGATPRHPTIGVFDAYDSNPLGVTNVFGDLYISTLPLLGDTTDAPVVRMVLKG